MYTLSKYNYIKTLVDKRTLIWNTYTGSLFILEKNEYEELKIFNGLTFRDNFQYYIDSGILVEDKNDNDQLTFIKNLRKNTFTEQKEISFRILPTTGCS